MSEAPRRYTIEEDQQIREAAEVALREGNRLEPVFEELSEKLNRTAVALSYRYYNMIRKTMSEEQLSFLPPNDGNKTDGRVRYTPEDDERIWAAVEIAESEGIPLSAVYVKLGEDLERTADAIRLRCKLLKKKHRGEEENDDDDDDGDADVGVVSKLRALVKERDKYKKQYEDLRKEVEDKLHNYDKMARELRKIRKLLD